MSQPRPKIEPAGSKKRAPRPKPGLPAHYLKIVKEFKGTLAGLLAGSLVGAATLGLALPYVILKITDEAVIKRNLNALGFYLLLGFGALVVNAATRYGLQITRARLRNAVVRQVSLNLLRDFYRLPYKRVLQKSRGYFLTRMWDETPRAVEPFLQIFIDLSVTGLSMLVSLAVVFYLSWRVGLLFCVGIPVFLYLSRRISAGIRRAWKEVLEGEAESKGFLERLIGAHRVVNLFPMYARMRHRYDQVLKVQIEKLMAHARFTAIFGSAGAGYVNFSALAVLGLAGYEVIQGRTSLGGMLAITNIYARVIGYAQNLVAAIPNLQNARVTLERLSEFEAQAEESPPTVSEQGVAVRDMGFAFNSQEICTGVNLDIHPGEKVLVLGANGTGKTTLAHVVSGILRPTSGTAEVPSADRISAAFFPPIFVPGDVAENVGYAELSPEKQEFFRQLCKSFELADIIDEDPRDLSAGQRQKVSLLRALLKDADLYIFDEPFANLDTKTKEQLFQTLLDFTQGKSVLMIMHGEDQLHSAFDQVIDLDESGSHLSQQAQDGQDRGNAKALEPERI